MPTIELISVECLKVPKLPEYSSFAYKADTKLVSHRGLFQSVFDSLTGTIVHLANKSLKHKRDGFWFAGEIMDWSYDDSLMFLPNTRRDIEDLMRRLIDASPARRITFSTDYQFGGRKKKCDEVTVSDFFQLHDKKVLRYNKLWHIRLND